MRGEESEKIAMLEIIILIFLGRRIAEKAEDHGLNPVLYVIC